MKSRKKTISDFNTETSLAYVIAWTSIPAETSKFNLCEKASPVICFWWPLSFILTYLKIRGNIKNILIRNRKIKLTNENTKRS